MNLTPFKHKIELLHKMAAIDIIGIDIFIKELEETKVSLQQYTLYPLPPRPFLEQVAIEHACNHTCTRMFRPVISCTCK